jgi:hypothetical protein
MNDLVDQIIVRINFIPDPVYLLLIKSHDRIMRMFNKVTTLLLFHFIPTGCSVIIPTLLQYLVKIAYFKVSTDHDAINHD